MQCVLKYSAESRVKNRILRDGHMVAKTIEHRTAIFDFYFTGIDAIYKDRPVTEHNCTFAVILSSNIERTGLRNAGIESKALKYNLGFGVSLFHNDVSFPVGQASLWQQQPSQVAAVMVHELNKAVSQPDTQLQQFTYCMG